MVSDYHAIETVYTTVVCYGMFTSVFNSKEIALYFIGYNGHKTLHFGVTATLRVEIIRNI